MENNNINLEKKNKIIKLKNFLSQAIHVTNILIFLSLTIFLPKFISSQVNNKIIHEIAVQQKNFKLGLENLNSKKITSYKNIALITNQTGKTQAGQRNIDFLLSRKANLKKIFVPELGLDGKISAEKHVPDSVDQKTNIPVISLYPGDRTKKLDKNDLEDVDTIIFDIQESGMRHFTYLTTMFQAMDAASEFDKKIVVLDRPNLLGSYTEGPLVEPNLKSLVSYAPIALRHGMTCAELAKYYNKNILKKEANLEVICMSGYKRNGINTAKNLIAALSPNIPSISACHGYSFLGLLGEINPINVGVGTDTPFQIITLPDTVKFPAENWKNFKKILDRYDIESCPCKFFDNKKNSSFIGLKIKINNINTTKSFNLLIEIIKFFKKHHVELRFSKLFDKAVGSKNVREYLEGKISLKNFKNNINNGLLKFYRQARTCILYAPVPATCYL